MVKGEGGGTYEEGCKAFENAEYWAGETEKVCVYGGKVRPEETLRVHAGDMSGFRDGIVAWMEVEVTRHECATCGNQGLDEVKQSRERCEGRVPRDEFDGGRGEMVGDQEEGKQEEGRRAEPVEGEGQGEEDLDGGAGADEAVDEDGDHHEVCLGGGD